MEERFDDVLETVEDTTEVVEEVVEVEEVEVKEVEGDGKKPKAESKNKIKLSKNTIIGIAAGVAVVAVVGVAATMFTGDSGSTLTLEGYKGIEVEEIESITVDDDYIAEYIEYVLSESTMLESVDREAGEGDFVNIDYVGSVDGVEFEGGTAEGYDLQLGSGTFIEGFEEQLLEAKAGDEVLVEVTFPTEYGNEDLAGQEAEFAVVVNEVKELAIPELTDEFVTTVSYESTTVEEYMEEVRYMLTMDAESARIEGMKSAVWTVFIDNAVVDTYPEKEIAAIKEKIEASVAAQADQYGMGLEDFVAGAGMDMDAFEVYLEDSAKQEYLMQEAVLFVANAEGLQLTEDEYDAEINTLITQAGYADIESVIESGYTVEDLRLNVLTEIVVTWLTENATWVPATNGAELEVEIEEAE